MRRYGWLLIAVLVVISSMLMWACGGGGDEKPGAATEPAATSPAGETPEARETAESGGSPEAATTPETGGDAGKFVELASRFKNATFKATYQISTTVETQGIEGTMIWYKKGDNLRMDFDSEVEGQEMSAIIIVGPDESYICSDNPETGEGGSCFSTPAEPGQGVDQIVGGLEQTLADPNVEITGTESREIAGEATECFTMRSSESGDESEVCMSNDGVPLWSKTTADQGEVVLEATDFSPDVSDGDFEPPYPISEDAPDLSGQGQ
jgi:hypothetical protein